LFVVVVVLTQIYFCKTDAEVTPFAVNMGCTVVAALLEDGMIHVANCGDTRAVLCSSAGMAERLTVDHKPSLPDEIKRIEELGGFVRNGRVQGFVSFVVFFFSLSTHKYKQVNLLFLVLWGTPTLLHSFRVNRIYVLQPSRKITRI
jgi:serine/threonine protein phosphatase PrpC